MLREVLHYGKLALALPQGLWAKPPTEPEEQIRYQIAHRAEHFLGPRRGRRLRPTGQSVQRLVPRGRLLLRGPAKRGSNAGFGADPKATSNGRCPT